MAPEMIGAVIGRVRAIESEVDSLRRCIDGADLVSSDRQYLARCFDLLDLELDALREYVVGLRG